VPNNKTQPPSDAQISNFIEQGFLRLDDAFPPELAVHARNVLWGAMALSPDNPKGWTQPIIRLGLFSDPPFVTAANTPRLHAAYNVLVGDGRWLPPTGLGTFPIRFPSTEDPGDLGWHVDMSFGTENADFMQWRVNIVSRGRALLMLFLFSDVGEADAPTRIRVGSHTRIARQLLPYGVEGLTLAQLASDGFAGTFNCHETLATALTIKATYRKARERSI